MKVELLNHKIAVEEKYKTDGNDVWELQQLFQTSTESDYYAPITSNSRDELTENEIKVISWILDSDKIYRHLIENSIDNTLYFAKDYNMMHFTTRMTGWVYMRPQDYTFWKLSQPR